MGKLIFQHWSTVRHRDANYNIVAILYGRKASGESVAIRVSGISAYGFVRFREGVGLSNPNENNNLARLNAMLKWYMTMTRIENIAKKYKREHNEEKSKSFNSLKF